MHWRYILYSRHFSSVPARFNHRAMLKLSSALRIVAQFQTICKFCGLLARGRQMKHGTKHCSAKTDYHADHAVIH